MSAAPAAPAGSQRRIPGLERQAARDYLAAQQSAEDAYRSGCGARKLERLRAAAEQAWADVQFLMPGAVDR